MTYYHFVCILLLLHKPVDQSSLVDQLRSYRGLAKDIESHCLEICGIAAGRPSPAARVHIVQPLFLAGQCLEGPRERKAVAQLLRDIETDTGWPTEDLVKKLQQEDAGDNSLVEHAT
jgi:hypothetical protein